MTQHDLATLATRYGITASALRAAIKRGDLPATKFGKTWVVESGAFEAWATNEAMHKRGRRAGNKAGDKE